MQCPQCHNNALLIVNTAPGTRKGAICQFNYELFLQHCLLTQHSNTADRIEHTSLNNVPFLFVVLIRLLYDLGVNLCS